MLYDIKIKIAYDYDVPASGARHMVRVLPMSIPGRQRLIAGTVAIVPAPEERVDMVDFFGNTVTSVYFRSAHSHSEVNMQARVQVDVQAPALAFPAAPMRLPANCRRSPRSGRIRPIISSARAPNCATSR